MGTPFFQQQIFGLSGLSLASPHIWVAQAFQDNLFTNVSQAWDSFIQTGQVWALIIGFVLGYLFRGITSS